MNLYILNHDQELPLEHQDGRIDETVLQLSRDSTIEVQIAQFRSIFTLFLFYGLFSAAKETEVPLFLPMGIEKKGLSDEMREER
jgi:hypothetical protein